MKKLPFLLLIAGLFFTTFCRGQEEARLLRFPAIYGNQIVFTYAGDLYTVDRTGGTARKLTNDVGFEMFARFSPDGKNIAFTGQYDGNTEVYVMPAAGGVPKRLTITATLGRDDMSDRMGPNNIVMTWTPDGKNIVYRSRKQTFNDFKGQLFTVPVTGGLSNELPLPCGGFCSYSADGKKLAYNRVFREFRTWKYYRGGMADDISIYDFASKQTVNITNNDAQDIFPMWKGDNIYFLSDRDRTMNLFVYNTVTKETKKLTRFTEYDVKFPSLGNDAIVFENGGFIYVFDLQTQQQTKITVVIADDFDRGRNELKDASKNINTAGISPDGKRIVVGARGDIFTVPVKSGITRNLTGSSAAHDREGTWSPDGKYIAYLSDKSGEYEIYIQKQDGSEEGVAVTKGADTYKFSLSWSPDSKKILWNDKMLRLQYVDIETKEITLVDKSKVWEFTQFSWSPDSKWIAYANPLPSGVSTIILYNLQTKEKTSVTDEWFDSGLPVFSNDGKYLSFTSQRDFNPIYSNIEWNYAYRDMTKIYLVTLQKSTISPFAPENDEVKIQEPEAQKPDDPKKSEKKEAKPEAKKGVEVKIDLGGIKDRILSLPVKAGNYWNVVIVNEMVYYNEQSAGDADNSLKIFDLKKKKETEIGQGMIFDLSADYKKMLINRKGTYYVIDLPGAKINLEDPVSLVNLKIWVNNKEEWKQIYNECWRQMRDFFYVPNMHGVNWPAMRDKYAALLPWVNDRNDLNYLIGEMIGELSIGHAYINGGDRRMPDRIATGLLGAKISKDASGYFRVDQLLKGENWSQSDRSPLTELGVNVSTGDFILAINGKDLKNVDDFYQYLINTAGQQVELTVNNTADTKGSRKVIVTPVRSEADLYYYTWVQENIRKVSEATNGQVGYIHIPDMSSEGLNEFVKYFYPQLEKKALIIDDRGNGGGNVSPMIIERLQRVVTRSTMARNAEIPSHTPEAMILGPKVMLIDHYSASDGDLFPYAFKKHKLGKVIGTRTWGGVVGIRGSLPLVDGGDLKKPEFTSYSSDESQWIIEGHGVEPDIYIENDPAKEYAGIDEQLNKAIEVALDELKNYKPTPPIPPAPDKSK
ncbi:MAG: S41 family peptidase [Bacteroidetes bacterium]|nr:S41 family peptidase [Bacteroidota bacterium]